MNVESKLTRAIEKSGLNFHYNFRVNETDNRITAIVNLDAEDRQLGKHSNKQRMELDVTGASSRTIAELTADIIAKWGK